MAATSAIANELRESSRRAPRPVEPGADVSAGGGDHQAVEEVGGADETQPAYADHQ